MCAHGRVCLFGDVASGEMQLNAFGRIVAESWKWLSWQYPYVEMDEWVVMPNHIHGILVIGENHSTGGSRTAPTNESPNQRKPLGRLIGAFKTVSTKRINATRDKGGRPVWQRNYYEHIVRNADDLHQIRKYVLENPPHWAEDEYHPSVSVDADRN